MTASHLLLLFQINNLKNKKFINSEVKKIISFEKIDTESLINFEKYLMRKYEKIINKDLKRKCLLV